MSTPLLHKTEPIAGYTIRERIGAGGYGEVWRAEAPGGLEKAIKFVYGHLDETRAACELKALSRVKEARHPFLLSLERVEVVDGQLIIVTELAERSLKDRFDECRRAAAAGIPRDELLGYMADAADALDYLRVHYSLQHLDIKPENLLLVGGHIKVADFGLVKDLQHTHISLVAGLTPVYAPPEAFDDTISSTSDQYSLAIVYQEMLSGVLPFPGRTAAQLASQHRYSKPQLGVLPESDRAAIARSLAKDPSDRFPSCLALVEALRGDRSTGGVSRPAVQPDSTSDTTPGSLLATELIRESGSKPSWQCPPQPRPGEPSPLVLAPAPKPAAELPPVVASEESAQLRPTLFLGIGGAAAAVLRQLRGRLRNRFGGCIVPSLAMLLVDTDRREIHNAVQGNEATALDFRDTLLMPLRRPAHYRDESDRVLKWLSRRWLYNIPASLQTEGLRPLGRLAMVDHGPIFADRLRTILQTITSEASLAASAEATGMKVASSDPRIYVVASISGGSGGGMVIDTAYLIRHALQELCLADEGLCGILLYGSGGHGREADLGAANASVCLMELEQFCREGYPGDEACGLPAFSRGPTFRDTYLVYLGDDLNQKHCEKAADAVAEYLYLNSATSAAGVFDACRQQPSEGAANGDTGVRYRTFGLSRVGCLHSDLVDETANRLASAVLRRWCGDPADRRGGLRSAGEDSSGTRRRIGDAIAKVSDDAIDEFALNSDAMVLEIRRLAEEVLGSTPDQFSRGILGPVLADTRGRAPQEILAEITAAVGPPLGETRPDGLSPATWQWRLSASAKELAKNRGRAIRNRLGEIADADVFSLAALRQVIQRLEGRLNDLGRVFSSHVRDMEAQLGHVVADCLAGATGRRRWFTRRRQQERRVWDAWQAIVALRLEQTENWAAEQMVRVLRSELAWLRDQSGSLLQELNLVANRFPQTAADDPNGNSDAPLDVQRSVEDRTRRQIEDRFGEIIDRLAAEFAREHLAPQGGMKGLLAQCRELSRWLPSALQIAAGRAAVAAIRDTDAVVRLLEQAASDPEPLRQIQSQSSARLATCGGGKRLLAFLPVSADHGLRGAAEEALGCGQVVGLEFDNELVFCQEFADMPFGQVAAAICDNNRGYAELTARLHTRIDVVWKRLQIRGYTGN